MFAGLARASTTCCTDSFLVARSFARHAASANENMIHAMLSILAIRPESPQVSLDPSDAPVHRVIARDMHLNLPISDLKHVRAEDVFQSDRKPGTKPAEDESAKMLEIIKANFEGVQETRDVFKSVEGALQPSWEWCSSVDYSASSCLQDSGSFLCKGNTDTTAKATIEALGISECFFGENGIVDSNGQHKGLCKAVMAFIKVSAPCGPASDGSLAASPSPSPNHSSRLPMS